MASHLCKYTSAATTTNGYEFTGHYESLDNPCKSKDEILADRAARDALAAQRRGNKGRMR